MIKLAQKYICAPGNINIKKFNFILNSQQKQIHKFIMIEFKHKYTIQYMRKNGT